MTAAYSTATRDGGKIRRLLVPMATTLVVSVVIGWAYNRASPLGIRSEPSTLAAKSDGQHASSTMTSSARPASSSMVQTGYFNETIAMSLEPVNALAHGISGEQLAPLTLPSPSSARSARNLQSAIASIPSLTWRDVKPRLADGKTVLVDARATAHFQAGHIPGAVSLPGTLSPAEVADFVTKYPQSAPLIVYCGTPECPLAHRLAETLVSSYGYTNVAVMPGGYAEYRLAESKAAVEPASAPKIQ